MHSRLNGPGQVHSKIAIIMDRSHHGPAETTCRYGDGAVLLSCHVAAICAERVRLHMIQWTSSTKTRGFVEEPAQSSGYEKANPKWYDLIETWAKSDGSGDSFVSGDYLVNVNMDNLHGAIQSANPDFLQTYDDKLVGSTGEAARNSAGTIDRRLAKQDCLRGRTKVADYRSTAPLVEDFSEGWAVLVLRRQSQRLLRRRQVQQKTSLQKHQRDQRYSEWRGKECTGPDGMEWGQPRCLSWTCLP